MLRKLFLVLSILATALFAGGEKGALDPCQLLTKQEAEKVLGTAVKPGRLNSSGTLFGTLSCEYLTVDRFEKSGSVTVMVGTTAFMKANDAIFESAKEKYEKEKQAHIQALKAQHKGKSFDAIEGLGDDAYWNGVGLSILKGETYLSIRVSASSGLHAKSAHKLAKKSSEKNLALSKEIAQIVLPKLQ
jgi:hypothetical protein